MAIEKIVNIKVNDDVKETTNNVVSLKTELRKAQQEVAQLSEKFGATSKEAVEAAKRAAILKDKIGDAKTLTDAFNPDAKFKALSASLSGVAGAFSAYQGILGLTNADTKEFEKTLLKVQSAMAISQGLQALGEAKDSFSQLKAVAVNAFSSIKAAIGSTGIGLLVIALGTLYTYWDDIKETVSGVNEEQINLNETINASAIKSKEHLSTLDSQDETLKRQGKTEREILSIKEKQTKEAINAQIVAIESNTQLRKTQLEAAEKNKEILKGILDFAGKPLIFLLEGIDLIGKKLGKNLGLAEGFKNSTANLFFDPEKTKKEGEAAAKEEQKILVELKNKRDGYLNQIDSIDKEAAKKAILTEEEKKKKLKEINDKFNKSIQEDSQDFDLTELQAKQDKVNNDVKFKEDEIAREQQFQLEYSQILYDSISERNAREEEARQLRLEGVKANMEAVSLVAKSGEEFLSALQDSGLARTKAGNVAMKALALVQIGADSAIAFSKMMQGTEVVATETAKSVPLAASGAAYLATKIAFYASGSATILANLARAKQLLSGGGSASAVGRASGGGGSASAPPSFNIVGQNSNNQLAQSIANKQQQPIEAYVVSGKVTSSQSLDRNKIDTATFN